MRSVPYEGRPQLPRAPRSLIVWLVVLLAVFIGALQSVSFYVDNLWFSSLGFESVFWYRIKAQTTAFILFFVATTLILWVMFRLVIPRSRGPRRPLFELNGQYVYLPGLDTVRNLARPVAVLIGVFLALGFSSTWETFTLFSNRPATSSVVDPIFGHGLGFFLFALPVLDVVA